MDESRKVIDERDRVVVIFLDDHRETFSNSMLVQYWFLLSTEEFMKKFKFYWYPPIRVRMQFHKNQRRDVSIH